MRRQIISLPALQQQLPLRRRPSSTLFLLTLVLPSSTLSRSLRIFAASALRMLRTSLRALPRPLRKASPRKTQRRSQLTSRQQALKLKLSNFISHKEKMQPPAGCIFSYITKSRDKQALLCKVSSAAGGEGLYNADFKMTDEVS